MEIVAPYGIGHSRASLIAGESRLFLDTEDRKRAIYEGRAGKLHLRLMVGLSGSYICSSRFGPRTRSTNLFRIGHKDNMMILYYADFATENLRAVFTPTFDASDLATETAQGSE